VGKIAVDKIINGLITRKVCVMHLDSLKIKNFRILEDVTIEKLGHVNLIVGKNNSGKTAILEAIHLLASGFFPSSVMSIARNRDDIKRVSIEERRTETRVAFENFFFGRRYPNIQDENIFIGDSKNHLTVSYIFYQEIETIEKSDDLTLVRTEQKIMINDNDNIGDYDGKYRPALQIKVANEQSKIVDLEEDENLSYRKLQSFKKLFNISNVESSVSSIDDLAKEWDNIIFSDDETHVIDALRIIEPKIESLAFLSDDYQHLRFDRNRIIRGDEVRVPYVKLSGVEGRTPLHSMGDGVFRLLQIILKLFSAKNGFLLIDEFENGLHYSVQPKVWELIFELAHRFNIQVFATTHSWDCIESFSQVAKDRTDMKGVLFRMGHSVRKSDKGKLIATVFDEDDLYNLTKMNIEVR
jgi:AAA15 family ATPase/GTPase